MGIHPRLQWSGWVMTQTSLPAEGVERLREASDWLVRLRETDLSDADIVGWLEWCERHSGNRIAFERLLPLWQALDPLHPQTAAARLEKLRRWSEQERFPAAAKQPVWSRHIRLQPRVGVALTASL